MVEKASGGGVGVGRGEAVFFSEHLDMKYDRWRQHSSPVRYGRHLVGLFIGTTTRRVLPVVASLVVFSELVEQYNLIASADKGLPSLVLPIEPFEITSAMIGLLLVFRTESSYGRYKQGGKLAQQITARLREMVCRLLSWSLEQENRVGAAPVEAAALCETLVAYQQWIFLRHLQPESELASQAPPALRRVARLPEAAEGPLSLATVQFAMCQQVRELSQKGGGGLWKRLDDELIHLADLLSQCEHLIRTPIPLSYTRSTIRFLWMWLTLLPFALVNTFSDFGNGTWWEGRLQIVVPAAELFICIMFLSLEDVAVQIEEPFKAQRKQLEMTCDRFAEEVAELQATTKRFGASPEADDMEGRRRDQARKRPLSGVMREETEQV